MITSQLEVFLDFVEKSGSVVGESPRLQGVLMVKPAGLLVCEESAFDNVYMDVNDTVDLGLAMSQFNGLVELISQQGIEVFRFPGNPATPDAVFPNNVFATLNQRLIIGNMLHGVRQREAERQDIREHFVQRGYSIVDLSKQPGIAELTGVLIIDYRRRIGFCGMTGRVDQMGVQAMHEAFGLDMIFCFDLVAEEYHSNVVLMVLADRACVVYPGAFVDSSVPDAIAGVYPGQTLYLDEKEKNAFAGNCIALTDKDLFMSQTAVDALRVGSRDKLESWGFIIHSTGLDEIEKAGGSLRCMVAEVF